MALPATISPDAFSGLSPGAAITDLGGETMGTRWSVRAVVPATIAPARLRSAIVARLDRIVAEMSHWLPTSTLSRFNRLAAGQSMPLPPDFAHVIAAGLEIGAATGGAFDPTIGRLVDVHGFGPVPTAAAPHPDEIGAALAASGWTKMDLSPADRRLTQPGGLALDLSGIAKGHAVDAVADLLAGLGIRHALVEIGGELVGRGVRPDGQPWWVELENPPGTRLAPLRIALHGLAVATSGDYRRGAHTIDPRTGHAITSGIVSASVLHRTALAADAWATALTVLGAPGIALADGAGIAARLVSSGPGGYAEHISAALAAMLADD